MATLGGIHGSHSQNSIEIDNLARFAVDEHNKKEVLFYTKCIGLAMLIDWYADFSSICLTECPVWVWKGYKS